MTGTLRCILQFNVHMVQAQSPSPVPLSDCLLLIPRKGMGRSILCIWLNLPLLFPFQIASSSSPGRVWEDQHCVSGSISPSCSPFRLPPPRPQEGYGKINIVYLAQSPPPVPLSDCLLLVPRKGMGRSTLCIWLNLPLLFPFQIASSSSPGRVWEDQHCVSGSISLF